MSSVKKSSSPETEVIVWAAYRILVWFAECHESHNLFDFFCLAFYVCTTYLGLRFFPIYIKIIIKKNNRNNSFPYTFSSVCDIKISKINVPVAGHMGACHFCFP